MKAPRRRRNLTPCTITFLPSPANAKWVFTEPNSTATTHKLFVHVEICLEITKWSVYPTCTLVQRLEYGFHRCLSHWFEMEMKSCLALENQWVFPALPSSLGALVGRSFEKRIGTPGFGSGTCHAIF